jgi:hypothetical protein
VIREVDRFVKQVGKVGHGTRIADSIAATLRGTTRVFVISDMQTFGSASGTGNVTSVVPRGTPLYGFNLGGYRPHRVRRRHRRTGSSSAASPTRRSG